MLSVSGSGEFMIPSSKSDLEKESVVLYRPVGQSELEFVEASGFRAFPPRLGHQPIFYSVLSEEYAHEIAKRWNTDDTSSGKVGYVTRFRVRTAFLARYPVRTVGARYHQEYWVPAEELPEFNSHIVGSIEVIAKYEASQVT
jgi:hypothetical protein